MPASQHSLLANLATEVGTSVPSAGNLPVALEDPQYAWYVEQGAVDLFLVEYQNGVQQSARQHVLRATAGRLLPGVAAQDDETTLSLVVTGLVGSVLRRLPIASLEVLPQAELADQIDTYLADVAAMLGRDTLQRARPDMLAEPRQALPTSQGTLSARRRVMWVSLPPPGTGLFMDLIDPTEFASDDDAGLLPLTPASWLTLLEAAPLSVKSSEELAEDGVLMPALTSFHKTAFALERLNRRLAVVDQANVERARATNRRTDEEGARRHLFNLFGLPDDGAGVTHSAALKGALWTVGRREGIEFRWPDRSGASETPVQLSQILDASDVRARKVNLTREDKWWTGDGSAMLAFREDGGRPVALLPSILGRYREVDPVTGRSAQVTARRARELRSEAWMFYRPLPSDSVRPAALLKMASKGLTTDVARLVLSGLPRGLILLLPAVVLGFLVDQAVPTGDVGLVYTATAGLAALGVIGVLLHILQGMATMRLEGRITSRIEAAIWDRLLRLPTGILHRYPSGDLAMRGMTFQRLRDAVQGVVADATLSILFLLPALALIFFYDSLLGGTVLALSIVHLIVAITLGLRQIAPYGRLIRAIRRVAGRLFQIVNGISKLRVDSAEGSAFAVWARDYRVQKQAEIELGAIEEHLQAFGAALPFLGGAVVLFTAAQFSEGTLAVGDFLVAYTVFLVFQTAVARLGESLGAVSAILPTFEQVRPFLAAVPESAASGEPVEQLGGDVLFERVSFRYEPDGPLILDDVTIRARPGEFVAIAGESGAGKSTLFRIALGQVRPSAGSVYYDGRDLRHLNTKQVRRNIGAVPQDVQLHPNDLWDNIVAHHDEVTNEELWQAAQTAQIDREINAMPMGMLTPVGGSGSVLSGGESQRIMIARSLVRNPRILLLDEATNWLDNENQAEVMQNLARLSSTRIVIAHRLSTLRQADRIFVMQSGKVVQEGTFAELASSEGVFQGLVRRQIA
ncbi:MAG: ATP-binding cassette domain-containing protein [Rhodospirillales bacterium]|nr:ATP-binding cassette domain-containing protein [Rhodospirillales bacterium]